MRVSYRGGVPFLIVQRYGNLYGIHKFILRNFAFLFFYLVWEVSNRLANAAIFGRVRRLRRRSGYARLPTVGAFGTR